MNAVYRDALWPQFGAAIDMLENAVRACPDALWAASDQKPAYWYLVFHALFFLDCYLSESVEKFAPPAPFTLDELNPDGILPDRAYTKAELLSYLEYGRAKCHSAIQELTVEGAKARRRFGSIEGSAVELFLYNLRHVQHHAAQLHLLLRQTTDDAPLWVARARPA